MEVLFSQRHDMQYMCVYINTGAMDVHVDLAYI